jgi:ribosomal protein S18 acetylase RimI-like enzyme
MTYQIRAAVPADLEPMLVLFPRLAAFDLPPERSAEDLWRGDAELLKVWSTGAVPQCLVYVAVGGDSEILGITIVQLRSELLSNRPSAHIEALVVHGDAEGRGIGRALMVAAEEGARARGAESLTLHVFSTNTRARALYERLGYAGELIRYIKHLAPDGQEAE